MNHCKTETAVQRLHGHQSDLMRAAGGAMLIPAVLGLLTVTAIAAAVWQWQRSEGHTHKANIAIAQVLQPRSLNTDSALSAHFAKVTGMWLPDSTTYVSPRMVAGRMGALVVSVLGYTDSAGKMQYIAVQRGWAAQASPTVAPAIAALSSVPVQLEGELVQALPRAFELQSIKPQRLGLWQNYEPSAHAAILNIGLQPNILVLSPSSPDAERQQLQRIAPHQAIDTLRQKASSNRGYALQWLGLALVGMLGLGWMWRSRFKP